MSKWVFDFRAIYDGQLLDDTAAHKNRMEIIEGKQFCIPEFEKQLLANPNCSDFKFSVPDCITDDYVKLATVLRNREAGKSTAPKHQCGAAHMHEHKSGFDDLDRLPQPRISLDFELSGVKCFGAGSYEKDVWALKGKTELSENIEKYHLEGNAFFKQAKFESAITAYQKTLQLLTNLKNQADLDELKPLQQRETTITLNICQCLIQLKRGWSDIIKHCTAIIEQDSTNPKVYYRRAIANIELLNKESAQADVEMVLKLDSSTPTKRSCEKLMARLSKYEKDRDSALAKSLKSAFIV